MARAKGFQGIVGVKKATTWGTAVAAGATDGVYVRSIDTPGNLVIEPIRGISGSVTALAPVPGNKSVSVSLATDLRYEGLEPLLAFVLGTAGAPSTVDTSGKQHVLKINNQIDGIFSTVAYELIKDTTVVEVPSVKWTGFTLRGRQGRPIEIEFRGIGDDYKYGTSSTNTTTTIDNVTLSSNLEWALFKHAVVNINAQNGADFGGTDLVYVTGFEINVDRAMEGRFSTERGDKISEPIETDFMKVTGSFEFPDVNTGTGGSSSLASDQLAFAGTAATAKKVKIKLTGATLAGASTQYMQHVLWLPYVVLGEGKPGIPGPEGQTWSQPFESFGVATIPTGFSAGYTGALTYEVFSKRSTDALA
jgi:hypothetical protein